MLLPPGHPTVICAFRAVNEDRHMQIYFKTIAEPATENDTAAYLGVKQIPRITDNVCCRLLWACWWPWQSHV